MTTFPNNVFNTLITYQLQIANNGAILLYSGTPAAGNLVGSWAPQAGDDQYGNPYVAGITLRNLTEQTYFQILTANNIPGIVANWGYTGLQEGNPAQILTNIQPNKESLVISSAAVGTPVSGDSSTITLTAINSANGSSIALFADSITFESNWSNYSLATGWNPGAGNYFNGLRYKSYGDYFLINGLVSTTQAITANSGIRVAVGGPVPAYNTLTPCAVEINGVFTTADARIEITDGALFLFGPANTAGNPYELYANALIPLT